MFSVLSPLEEGSIHLLGALVSISSNLICAPKLFSSKLLASKPSGEMYPIK
jgi:hypothetical protein